MDFFDRAAYSSELFLDYGARGSEDLVGIQSTLSEDRTAGAKAWEDGAIHDLDLISSPKHISQQKFLPGDIDVRLSEVIENTAEPEDDTLSHKERAAIIREQLVGNRKHLDRNSSHFLPPKLTPQDMKNPFGDIPSWKVLETIEKVKEIAGGPTLSLNTYNNSRKQMSHSYPAPPSSVENVSSDTRDSRDEEDLESDRKGDQESIKSTTKKDEIRSQYSSDYGWEGWRSKVKTKRPRKKVPRQSPSLAPSGSDDYRLNDPIAETYFTGHVLPEISYSDSAMTPAKYCIVCEIKCFAAQPYDHHRALMFEDAPFLRARSQAKDPHLEGSRPIQSIAKYVKDRDAGFLVIRQYFCNAENLSIPVVDVYELPSVIEKGRSYRARVKFVQPPTASEPQVYLDAKQRLDTMERLQVYSEPLITKIQSAAKSMPGQLIGSVDGQPSAPLEMYFPYIPTFHNRSKLRELLKEEAEPLKTLLDVFLEYSESCHGDKYKRADDLFSKGRVTPELRDFLFQINEPVVHREKDSFSAYIVSQVEAITWETLCFDCWSWSSSGSLLKRKKKSIMFQWPKDDEFAVDSLAIYPLKYASQETRESILQQGKKYWSLRSQHKVEYSGWNVPRDQLHVESRFMIDLPTYSKLHPNSATFAFSKDPILQYDKYPSEIELNADLSELDYILCPHVIQGFYLKEKHWVNLYVNNVKPVNWNKEAFDRLVLPPKTKELIKALLVRTGERNSDQVGVCDGKRQDLIAGKGTGLIVLLHGGPGTGKTLTAESVAELAEMPLYRVTAGDIGTEPEVVEAYLKRVLYFGKIWSCVLLIDEADVFLEERGLQDLKRNSLVSIFLRILEYYNGILILTSNRVGTFDEAFKSRIQLALRYPDPDPLFRQKIWRNFFDMLEADEEDADLEELKEHLDELSDLDMNGREIRNALTTARQLALYKKKTLGWVHLAQAVNAARDFNKYLMDVQGQTSKDWARELTLR